MRRIVMVTLVVGAVPTSRPMPVCTYFWKPVLVTSIMYGPMGRFGSTNPPSAPLVELRTAPVAVWVALISAPGITDPEESLTVPSS